MHMKYIYIILHCSLFQSVKLLFALAIFISYGLQFYVPTKFAFPPLIKLFPSSFSPYVADSCLRAIFVAMTCKL